MSIHAPFAFAPVSRFVHFPEWGDFVTHDVPFKDGFSGEIALTITARTPLLVGGPRRTATRDLAGEVWPVRMPDGTYAIPGSSLQGLIRSVLDVATFGKLGRFVQKRRYGVRDLTPQSATADSIYKKRISHTGPGNLVTPQAKAGWLIRQGDRKIVVPCRMARVRFDEIVSPQSNAMQTLLGRNDAPARYEAVLGRGAPLAGLDGRWHLDPEQAHAHQRGAISIRYRRGFRQVGPNRDAVDATLVLTGKGSGSNQLLEARKKKYEFLFYGPRRSEAQVRLDEGVGIELSPDVWDDFLLIHEKQTGRPANPNWDFWRTEFEHGRPVPIFYLWEPDPTTNVERITTLGTAFMFKTAHRLSTHELLCNSSPDHLDPEEDPLDPNKPFRLDFGSLVFGAVADDSGARGLRRRAAFDLARATRRLEPQQSGRTVLLSPKPSYYPLYVRQPAAFSAGNGASAQEIYATYTPPKVGQHPDEVRTPELSGVKVWPAKNGCAFPNLPESPPNINGQAAVIRLQALPAGAEFRTVLRIHNLRKVELGGLLWALTFGNREALAGRATPLRHRLGMGKPYQLGQVEVRVTGASLTPNDTTEGAGEAGPLVEAVAAFEAYMERVFTTAVTEPGSSWSASVQVKALLRAADPTENAGLNLNYMGLGAPHGGVGTYVGERASRRAPPPYVTGFEVPKGAGPSQSSSPRTAGASGDGRATSTSSSQAVVPQVFAVNARVALTVGPPSEGTVFELLAGGRVRIKLDNGKEQSYLTSVLRVIAPPPAGAE